MNVSSFRPRLLSSSVLVAAAIAFGSAVPALASTVTQTLTPGTLTASIANLTLGSVPYAHNNQPSTGSMTLTADDSTGTGAGWNVTVVTSSFAYTGANGGTAIAAANYALTSAAATVTTAGQAYDAVGGPHVPTVSPVGTLDTARKTVQANAAFGQGNYTQALGVTLTVPAYSRAGTYTGTLTSTVTAAP